MLGSFDAGYAEGQARVLDIPPALGPASEPFKPFASTNRASIVVTRHWLARRVARTEAAHLVAQGNIVTLLLLSRTFQRHRVRFDPHGFWEQLGGVYGQSERENTHLHVTSLKTRANREAERVKDVRKIDF